MLMSVLGSLWTKPVEQGVLKQFYRSVRPWGAWGPVKKCAVGPGEEQTLRSEGASSGIMNVLLGMAAIAGIYLCPMYLVGRWYGPAAAAFSVALASAVALYFTWYRKLPET